MARLRLAEGAPGKARGLLEEAERRYNTDMSPPVRPVTAVLARARLADGDVAAAQTWLTASDLGPDDELGYVREYEHVTVARVLIATGSTDDAVRLLERLRTAAEAGGRRGSTIEILVVLALALLSAGDEAGATDTLRDALLRARSTGHVRVFADELPALAPLLQAVPSSAVEFDHAQKVLASRSAPTAPVAPVAAAGRGLVDPLSDRELDVLRLLRGDLTGPEIARELHVSLNTMRTHTKNIFTKLGVTNRRQAVRRADDLGL